MLIKKRKLSTLRNVSPVKAVYVTETTRAAELEIHKAKQEANAIRQEAEKVLAESQKRLKEAEEKVKEIIRTTNLEAKALKEQVYNDTINAANAEAEQIKNSAKEILQELFTVKTKALNQAHSEIIDIALDLAKKIIRYEASVDPNILKVQVVEAIKRATPDTDRVQVYVNPSELSKLQESTPELEKLFPSGITIIPLAKESVDLGSCIIETKSGQLDASFSTQLNALTNLISNIEVKEPNISFEELTPVNNEPAQAIVFEEEETNTPLIEEAVFTGEEERLKEELLNDEPLIQVYDETLPFAGESKTEAVVHPVETTASKVENKEILEVPQQIISEPVPQAVKKKISLTDSFERTKEEAEELDKELALSEQKTESQVEVSVPKVDSETLFEFEEDDELPEEKAPEVKSILRPKKKTPGQISEIASEIEKSPEWKDLVQGEDEE